MNVKKCPKCNKKEIHIFHVNREILYDIDLHKERDIFNVSFNVFMCKHCHSLYQ